MNMEKSEREPSENWKPIEGHQDYLVSNQGRVKSLKWGKERILKPGLTSDGYQQVALWNEGTEQKKRVHRLVLEAFVPNPEEKPQCNHKNGIKTDNRLQNLEWVSSSENVRHAYETGLNPNKGNNLPRAKLTENEVLEILNDSDAGVPQQEIAAKYNVSRQNISAIKRGKSWAHLTEKTYKKPCSKKPVTFSSFSGKSVKQSALEAWV